MGLTSELRQVYEDRRVLVTGHTGFKGSWLALWLSRLGARISGFALPPETHPNLFEEGCVEQLLDRHDESDVRDLQAFRAAVDEVEPEIVFHLAAQPIVAESFRDPLTTLQTNVLGTANLLEAVRRAARPCAVIIVTSDKCYENHEQVWGYREQDALGGSDLYSASKASAEIVAAAYRRSFFDPRRLAEHGVRVATVRAGNVIGGGDWSQARIVPDLARCLVEGRTLTLRRPHATRPWQHVLEPLAGYLQLGRQLLGPWKQRHCTAWNFGPLPGENVSVQDLVNRFYREWGVGHWSGATTPPEFPEHHTLRLNIDKALAELCWRPRWDVDTAIARSARWYQRFLLEQADARRLCLDDLAAYEQAEDDAFQPLRPAPQPVTSLT